MQSSSSFNNQESAQPVAKAARVQTKNTFPPIQEDDEDQMDTDAVEALFVGPVSERV